MVSKSILIAFHFFATHVFFFEEVNCLTPDAFFSDTATAIAFIRNLIKTPQ